MASFVSENVAAEKMDAMRKFDRRRKFLKFLPAIEAFVAVLLLLSWLTPFLSAGEYLRQVISGGLTGGIFIFGVVNVLIALIFSLSNHQKLAEPDLYFQYVSSSAAAAKGGCSSAATAGCCSSSSTVVSKSSASEKEEKTSEGKPVTDLISVTLESKDNSLFAGEGRPMRREMVRAVSNVGKHEMTFMPSATIESSASDQVFRRSRSERLDRRGGFHRSVRGLCEIDDLSSDEFRSTVEMFIAGKKKMLLKD